MSEGALVLFWSFRLRVLARKQQLIVVCTGFIVGGFVLIVAPFTASFMLTVLSALLLIVSCVFLYLARILYSGMKELSGQEHELFRKGARSLKKSVPFKEDRKMILSKGIFAVLYSICLGFSLCAALVESLYPANEVVIGISNLIAALIMLVLLGKKERFTSDTVSKLFLPITAICYFFFAFLWSSYVVLLPILIILVLFACYEMINSHTAYAYSLYDSVRCYWEIYSSKLGNSCGVVIGWALATVALYCLKLDKTQLYALCFFIVVVVILIDSIFFKEMRFKFAETNVNDELSLEITGPKLVLDLSHNKGQWRRTCEQLSEKYSLSPRQKEVFFLLAKGRNVKYITEKLVLSTPTVKSHVYNIYQKMGVHSHQELLNIVEKTNKNN